jgi:hypothetical protein
MENISNIFFPSPPHPYPLFFPPPLSSSLSFIRIEDLGYKVWDIHSKSGETVEILLENSNQVQLMLTGRADFIISSSRATIIQAASQQAICVIKDQSNPKDEDCENQLVTYKVILKNRFGLLESWDAGYQAMYEQNEQFLIYQLPEILPTLLDF